MTALIVDDEPLARVHLRRLLEGQEIEVLGESESAAQALRQAEDLRPELVFLDIQMPGLTGMQMAGALTRRLAELNQRAVHGGVSVPSKR